MPKTILVVDDVESMRHMLKSVLEKSGGHKVITASSKEEGLARYHEYRKAIDMIVTDCDMPEKGQGLELITDIRNHGGNIPILMISARTDVEQQLRLKQGNNPFFQKPFRATELISKVNEMLAGPKQQVG